MLLVVLVLTAATGTSGTAIQSPRSEPKYVPKPTDFAIVCTLFNEPPTGSKVEGPDLPITYDAHIVVVARVERVEFGKSPWPVGTLLNFVVHSPTMSFGDRFAGTQFVLTLSPFRTATPDEKIWFSPETKYLLQAVEKVKPKSSNGGA